MPNIKEKLIALLCQATFGVNKQTLEDKLTPSAIDEIADQLIASSLVEELQNEAYDLGVDSALHNHFGLSWEDAAGLRKEIKQLQDASRWIPVTERLPEEHDSIFAKMYGTIKWMPAMFRKISNTVIACIESTDGKRKTVATYTKDGEWEKSARYRRGDKVTHWMPLPAPPKGE